MQEDKKRYSGLGISSFVIGLVVAILEFVLLIVAGVIEITKGLQSDPLSLSVIIVCLFTGVGLSCFGLGLSVGGLLQDKRKKTFSIFGFLLNFIIVLAMASLIFITTLSS
jgi:hypothetical protein